MADQNMYLKRTQKIVAILEGDTRLNDGLDDNCSVYSGVPDNRMQAAAGPAVFVRWDGTPTVGLLDWSGGSKQEHHPRWIIAYLIEDYSHDNRVGELFEMLTANLFRVLADHFQEAGFWQKAEVVSAEHALLEPAEEQYWRYGHIQFEVVFREDV